MKQETIHQCQSTLQQRSAIKVTVYNINLAMVTDQRKIKLPKGLTELKFEDVPTTLEDDSVHIHSVTAPDDLSVLEQNCEYERIEPRHVLSRYVGKEVKLYRKNYQTGQRELTTATILHSDNDGVTYQVGDEIVMTPPEEIVFPNASANLMTQPAIKWLLRNNEPSPQTIEAAYLTRGVSWRAHYNIVFNSESAMADILGWATIGNGCGTDFVNATLTLVAGDINRPPRAEHEDALEYSLRPASVPVKEESFSDYHSYFLARQVSLKNGQTKQIELLKARNVKLKMEYRLSGPALHNIKSGLNRQSRANDVGLYMVIENRKEHGLGMPLPKGHFHVYKHDSNGRLQFVGEDDIGHVPENEIVSVRIGNAFDIKAIRIQTDGKEISPKVYEAAFEITIRNHKNEDVNIRVLEEIPSHWEIVNYSHKYKRVDASLVEWLTKVKCNGDAMLTYRIRIPA